MKKKLLSIILATALVVSNLAICISANEFIGDDYENYPQVWLSVGPGANDQVLVQGNRVIDSNEDIVTANIPSTYNGIDIGRVMNDVFRYRTSLETLSIPSTVFDFAWDLALGATKLQAITVDSANELLTSVNGVVYSKDKSMLIVYPSGKTDESFTIASSVKVASPFLFFSNPYLKTVTIGSNSNFVDVDGVIYATSDMENALFPYGYNPDAQENFYIDIDSVVWDNAVSVKVGPGDNDYVKFIDGIIFDANQLIETAIIPAEVNGEAVLSMWGAFLDREKLSKLVLPNTLHSATSDFVQGTKSLEAIEMPESNNFLMVEDGVLYSANQIVILGYPGGKKDSTFNLKESVVNMEWWFFHNQSYLKEVTADKSNHVFASSNGFLYYKEDPTHIIYPMEYNKYNSYYNGIEIDIENYSPVDVMSDVSYSSWYYDAVKFAMEEGLFGGMSDNIFAPNQTMSSAMIWTVLYRNSGGAGETSGANWYQASQEWITQNDYASGLNPLNDMTREDLALLLYKIEGSKNISVDNTSSFVDGDDISEDAIDAMNWAVGVGLYQGNDTNTLNPNGTASRAEVATILMRYMG